MKARQFGLMLAALLACTTGSVSAGQVEDTAAVGPAPQHGKGEPEERRQGQRRIPKWWVDASGRAEVGITDQQSAKLEEIFQAALPAQRERWREFQKLEPLVEQLIKDGTADPAYVARQVERVEILRAEMAAARIMMLYRMLRELSPEQVERFRRMDARREAERRKSTDPQVRR